MELLKIQKGEFLKQIKVEEDKDRYLLLKIQEQLEDRGITRENILYLTKDLTEVQKQKLEGLYKEQINKYEKSFENYKNKIILIREKLKYNK